MMEEEIDLRPYIKIFIQRWWLIPLFILLGIGAAFVGSNFFTPEFEATAIVAIIESNDIVQFDPRFTDSTEEQPLNAFPELATSDEVLRNVITNLNLESVSLEAFRANLDSESGLDSSVLRLRVVADSPVQAANIANEWASTFVEWGNIVYLGQSEEQVLFYETQLSAAEENLAESNQRYTEFQSINQTTIISNTISFHQEDYSNLLNRQNEIEQLLDSAETFRAQLSQKPTTETISIADQITVLQLQSSTFLSEDNSVPMIVEFSSIDSRANLLAVGDTLNGLTGLIESLMTMGSQIENEIALKEPIILDLQKQRQEFLNRQSVLLRELLIAEETALSLGFKLQEERIKTQDNSQGFRVASRASAPSNPLNSQTQILYFLGALAGGLLGVVSLIALARRQVAAGEQNQQNE